MCIYRFCKTTLPSDITVNVDGVKFHLHMVLLLLFPSSVFDIRLVVFTHVKKLLLRDLCFLLVSLEYDFFFKYASNNVHIFLN